MPDSFLHERRDFKALVETVAESEKINDSALVEKDYWIMHAVFGLKQLGLTFELKGGTSLSKGFGIIQRFSEDIDIRIEPFDGLQVDTNPNHEKPAHIESRRVFYEKLRDKIKIPGITTVERDTNRFIWASLAHIHGIPGVPDWADWFASELQTHRAMMPALGIGCEPMIVKGQKEQFLDWLSWRVESEAIRIPASTGSIRWPRFNLESLFLPAK